MPVQVPIPATTIRLVRVFLASPGDLGEERRAAREAIDEVNKTIARPAGFHVDLIGWEDTISERRRPQQVINEDLQSCEMFIGIMWKKWGTPPDVDGKFSSGFEEEFTIATRKYDDCGSPIIRLYFKDIDDALLNDPGEDLKRVLAFRATTEAEKKTFFETFPEANDLARRVRISVADYINRLRGELEKEQQSSSAASKSPLQQPDTEEERDPQQSGNIPRLIHAKFLADLASEIADPDGIAAPVEIARLRNLANGLARSQNDQFVLHAHDANLLYSLRGNLTLSDLEITNIADAGLAGHVNENTPMWSWVADRLQVIPDWLALSTSTGGTNTRIGAFRAMALLNMDVPEQVLNQSRSEFINDWFHEEVAENVRVEALNFLGVVGRPEDRTAVNRELERRKASTVTAAIEASISIILRYEDAKAAAVFALNNSFDEIEEAVLAPILIGMQELDVNDLSAAFSHRCPQIRLEALRLLDERRALTADEVRELFSDASLGVREKALVIVGALEDRRWTKEEARPILVRKAKGGLFGSTLASHDWDAEAAVERVQLREFEAQPRLRLESIVQSAEGNWFLAYRALANRYFKSFAATLRHDFDDRFKHRFQNYVQFAKEIAPNSAITETVVNQMISAENFTRRDWIRKTANILVAQGDKADLGRIRKALDENAMDPSIEDIPFLSRRGEWEDIKRIQKISGDYRSRGPNISILTYKHPTSLAARSILKLIGTRLIELVNSDINGELLAAVVCYLEKSKFARLTNEQLNTLMKAKDDLVRKVSALRIVQVHNQARVLAIAEAYSSQSHRFYNAVRWLDLAVGFDHATARQAAARELSRIAQKWKR